MTDKETLGTTPTYGSELEETAATEPKPTEQPKEVKSKARRARRKNILEEANQVTHEDRQRMYGSPKDNMEHIARISSAITGKELTAQDVVAVMFSTKLSRERHAHKRDNLTDIAGYAWVLSQVEGEC